MGTNNLPKGNGSTALEVECLSIVRGGNVVIQDVSFTLERGQFAALVGPSGAGKTSLLRVLALLDLPARGKIKYFGQTASSKGDRWYISNSLLYPSVTYVPQTLALWPHMTLRENLLFAMELSPAPVEKVDFLTRKLGLSGLLDRKPQYVSQGQQQRCALMRALLLNPTILLLDEVTAALDEDLASDVWDLLLSLARGGCSIVASTHSGKLAVACDYRFRIRSQSLSVEPQPSNADL